MTPVRQIAGRAGGLKVFSSVGLVGFVLLLTLHPIVAPDFWWQLARGRAVWEGRLAPSQTLLAFEPNADADWLGGLPWYLLFETVGPSILSCGVAIIAALVAFAIAKPIRQRGRFNPIWIVLIFLGFAASRAAWSPTPALIDVCGVIAVWNLAGSLRGNLRPGKVAKLMLCQLLWANLASLSILGLVVTFARLNLVNHDRQPKLGFRRQCWLFTLLLLIGSTTPRGVYTLWDSLRVLLPWISADIGTLAAAGILPTFRHLPTAELTAFLILCACQLGLMLRRSPNPASGWRDVAMFVVAAVIAASATANLAPAAMLLMLSSLELCRPAPGRETGDEPDQEAPGSVRAAVLASTVLAAFALITAWGMWPGSRTRLGWGLPPQLEPALLADALAGLSLDGSGYCSGVREAGLLAWLRPGSIRPADVPQRALLSGRLSAHVRIGWDLAHSWRDQHRRSDGSWGGWLIPLRERRTRLLCISPDDVETIRALETSRWRPLAFDAPCLPYGMARDSDLRDRIAETQSLLNLVNAGEWTYPVPDASGAARHFDLCGWATGQPDRHIDLTYARTLLAMRCPFAALKVLTHGQRDGAAATRDEFRATQLSLAYEEALACGQVTRWRRLVYLQCGGDPAVLSRMLPPGESASPDVPERLHTAVSAYCRRDFESAKTNLADNDAVCLFALSEISLEEGNPREAARLLVELLLQFPDSVESEVARNVFSP